MKDIFPLTDGWRLHLQDGGSVPATCLVASTPT